MPTTSRRGVYQAVRCPDERRCPARRLTSASASWFAADSSMEAGISSAPSSTRSSVFSIEARKPASRRHRLGLGPLKRKPLYLAACHITAGDLTRKLAHAPDHPDTLCNADRSTRIQEVKSMRAPQAVIVSGQDQFHLQETLALRLKQIEKFEEHLHVS